jgi:hypothetical protein
MNKILNTILIFALLTMSFGCESDDEQNSGGKPEVQYVRALSAELPDNLITGEFLGARLAIIGNGLGGVNKIFFNDVPAILNPALVTNSSIIVNIPTTIPGIKENLVKLYTSNDSCYFEFEVKVPAPTVNSMSFEWTAIGDVTDINGNYFIDDPNAPLQVTFTGGVAATVENITLNKITVKVPEGALEGPVTVTSIYGSTRSPFYYKDSRNIFGNFDNGFSPDYDYFNGWHGAKAVSTDNAINGNYLIMNPTIQGEGGVADDGDNCYDKWCYNPDENDYLDAGKINDYVLKFEAKVSDDWSAGSLQIIFTGPEEVWCNWQSNASWPALAGSHGGNENWKRDAEYPRLLWTPWETTGKFNSEWITVTIPMSGCKYGWEGASASPKGTGHYKGFTLYVGNDGKNGTSCHPTILVDNVRIVPAK